MKGLYRHYKGEFYTVIGEAYIVKDEVKDRIVLYDSDDYIFKGYANHTETMERLAIYKGKDKDYYIVSSKTRGIDEDVVLYYDKDGTRWVRPIELFKGRVDIKGVVEERFTKVR